jgi:hypothetical protein
MPLSIDPRLPSDATDPVRLYKEAGINVLVSVES